MSYDYPGVVPHLSSKDANAAIEFYKRAFGAEESGERMLMDDGKRVMHCELKINGGTLMIADAMPEYGYPWVEPQGVTLNIITDDARSVWDRAVAAGCEVTMPLEVAFWGDLYGNLKDPFGHTWAFVGPAPKS
ncbi:VOC family protein [Aliihoeflea aestuarii]|jgi:PhnB protein|uniref:VOC family protein n=1 Tax=Aliihoeflea aestuarii TaxID=453840 RepID=UPI0020926F51|nr:VOC family protein [Aliihoeflea aestuarii]MCO6391067.1 VOC family protein [Aliihoeflea aestuarii]